MNGRIIATDETGHELTIHFAQPVNMKTFKLGAWVVVNLEKQIRTRKQNSFYWVFLEWMINPFGGDMQSYGHFSKDGLHESIKAWIKDYHSHDFVFDKKFSTRELTRQEFKRFFDFVSQELFVDKLGIDTSGFWVDFERYEAWQTTNPGGMSEYLKERMPF